MPQKKYFKESRLKIREKVKEKYGLTTADTLTKEQKKLVRKEVDAKMWEKIRARSRYQFRKIHFEKNRVRLRVAGYSIKGVSIPASKLVCHFSAQEIRRAAEKYLRLKEKYHI
jgi:hypothetical protein